MIHIYIYIRTHTLGTLYTRRYSTATLHAPTCTLRPQRCRCALRVSQGTGSLSKSTVARDFIAAT